jgi:hypothetical protein
VGPKTFNKLPGEVGVTHLGHTLRTTDFIADEFEFTRMEKNGKQGSRPRINY